MIPKGLVKNQMSESTIYFHQVWWETSICQLEYYHLEIKRLHTILCPVFFEIIQF